MKGMMDYCLDSRDERGFFQFAEYDWPFTDWSDIPYHDIQSFQQLLLLKSLETMAYFAGILDKEEDAENYISLVASLKENIWDVFWKEEVNGFVHLEADSCYIVNRYSNLYPILFGYLDKDQIAGIKDNILMKDTIPGLGTPFHRTYEVAALCEAGEYKYAIGEMKNNWKGMLEQGATTFWERYDPDQTGTEHYNHSGRPFGRSLCHIWSAGPIYIFSRYVAGLKPLEPGYKSYLIEPNLCGLEWFNTEMPVKGGWVRISMDRARITLHSDIPGGTCRFRSERKPKVNYGTVSEIGNDLYEMVLNADREYIIRYY